VFQGDEIRFGARFAELDPAFAVDPTSVMLYSERQYQLRHHTTSQVAATPEPFDVETAHEWTPLWSLTEDRFRALPTALMYYFYDGPGREQFIPTSNGCAAGNTIEEAIVQGFLELVERDAFAVWWYNRRPRPEVDLSTFAHDTLRNVKDRLRIIGRSVQVLDVTHDLAVPTYVAVSVLPDGNGVLLGSGSHFHPEIAALRAVTELCQHISAGTSQDNDVSRRRPHWQQTGIQNQPHLVAAGEVVPQPSPWPLGEPIDQLDEIEWAKRIVRNAGLELLVLDQTRPDIRFPVVRVVVPGMRHSWPRLARGRLQEVAYKMGWVDRILAEDELNPTPPSH
jgi:ribosomal protein S12 methylthiotransferase accessory factor